MERIQIKEDDFLWRFYCKRFSIEKLEVKDPKNLCRYFWTAVLGLGMWWYQEITFREKLWRLFLGSIVLFFTGAFLLALNGQDAATIVAWTWYFFLLLTILEFFIKTMQWIDNLPSKIVIPLVALVLAVLIASLWHFDNPAFHRLLSISWIIIKWGVLLIFAYVAVMFFILLSKKLLNDGGTKFVRSWNHCISYLSAKKQGICPFVIPPEGFVSKNNK